MFAWAVEHKVVPHNPLAGVAVTVPRKVSNRETKSFTEDEVRTILKAASATTQLRSKAATWKR